MIEELIAREPYRVLSVDCGLKNLGWSVWEDGILKQWGRLKLTDETSIVLQAQDITKTLLHHRQEIEPISCLVVE